MSAAGGLTVTGGTGGVTAHLPDLDRAAAVLADCAGDCGRLVGLVLAEAARCAGRAAAVLLTAPVSPLAPVVALDLLGSAAAGAAAAERLAQAARALAVAAGALAQVALVYRGREQALERLMTGVPIAVGAVVRGAVVATVLTPGGRLVLGSLAAQAGGGLLVVGAVRGDGPVAAARAGVTSVARAGPVDLVVRSVPGLLGVADVPAAARLVVGAGRVVGLLPPAHDDTSVAVHDLGVRTCAPAGGPSTGRPAAGVAELLERSQSVAAWREPGAGRHDTLPPGSVRPGRGEVRVDRVVGADGEVAWVVHVPGTQEWDSDGEGSPMDMAANLALVGGAGSAVTTGTAAALRHAGARPGQPVLLVGHSQGGLTAAHLAGDPLLRRHATVTHVVTAGSPVAGRPVPTGVRVMAIEHHDDLVPRLDGRVHPDLPDRVSVTTRAPDGPWRHDAVPAHSSGAYVETARRVDASDHPSLVDARAALAPFLDRDGASCTSRRYRLVRGGGEGVG
ncbi:hypothetical protein [Aquipuribacter nitratireducens]|uniref:PGAP1-like protein n=1 Tax=Aquipuribacter nitratireducens TaxID=650104 RepID=A0ABW0GNU9_9MICO